MDRLAVLEADSLSENGIRQGRGPDGEPLPLFRRWTMSELLAEPDEFTWLIRGLLAAPTYGQVAGEMKTLKSHIAGFVSVGLAAGVPIFERFTPPKAQPVLCYVGEGGRSLWTRRTRRIAGAMGVDPADLEGQLEPSFDTAPISSIIFQESLQRDLEEMHPGLVVLDPLYTYHGTGTRASDLHQEGALLNQLSGPCMDAGADLLVVNHMNQTGSGVNLKRITMAGSGEWSDSWFLLAHRVDPDVAAGRFQLTMEVGSRQWGGRSWELDLELGHFDEDSGAHVGEITWDLRPSTGQTIVDKSNNAIDKMRSRIIDTLTDEPATLTKSKVKEIVGGSRETFEKVFDDLAQTGVITHDKTGRNEAGTTKTRLVWALTPNLADTNRPGWPGEDF